MTIQDLKTDFEQYLKTTKPVFVSDLKKLLADLNFNYAAAGETADKFAAIFFEYSYDDLDIVCWATDKNTDIISDTIYYPSDNTLGKANKSSRWTYFFPEKISKSIQKLVDKNPDQEDEICDEYDGFKYRAYEKWFIECWKQAIKGRPKVNAFMSIHDTDTRTDLNTGLELREKEIIKLLKAKK